MWPPHLATCHALIFMIDGSDRPGILKAKERISDVSAHDQLAGVPCLILVNKQDLQMEVDFVVHIKEVFNPTIANLGVRECKVLGCSALTG